MPSYFDSTRVAGRNRDSARDSCLLWPSSVWLSVNDDGSHSKLPNPSTSVKAKLFQSFQPHNNFVHCFLQGSKNKKCYSCCCICFVKPCYQPYRRRLPPRWWECRIRLTNDQCWVSLTDSTTSVAAQRHNTWVLLPLQEVRLASQKVSLLMARSRDLHQKTNCILMKLLRTIEIMNFVVVSWKEYQNL